MLKRAENLDFFKKAIRLLKEVDKIFVWYLRLIEISRSAGWDSRTCMVAQCDIKNFSITKSKASDPLNSLQSRCFFIIALNYHSISLTMKFELINLYSHQGPRIWGGSPVLRTISPATKHYFKIHLEL